MCSDNTRKSGGPRHVPSSFSRRRHGVGVTGRCGRRTGPGGRQHHVGRQPHRAHVRHLWHGHHPAGPAVALRDGVRDRPRQGLAAAHAARPGQLGEHLVGHHGEQRQLRLPGDPVGRLRLSRLLRRVGGVPGGDEPGPLPGHQSAVDVRVAGHGECQYRRAAGNRLRLPAAAERPAGLPPALGSRGQGLAQRGRCPDQLRPGGRHRRPAGIGQRLPARRPGPLVVRRGCLAGQVVLPLRLARRVRPRWGGLLQRQRELHHAEAGREPAPGHDLHLQQPVPPVRVRRRPDRMPPGRHVVALGVRRWRTDPADVQHRAPGPGHAARELRRWRCPARTTRPIRGCTSTSTTRRTAVPERPPGSPCSARTKSVGGCSVRTGRRRPCRRRGPGRTATRSWPCRGR